MSRRGDWNAVLRAAKRAGCMVRKRGHYVIRTPSGARIVCSHSPSDVNAVHRLRRDLRDAGVSV